MKRCTMCGIASTRPNIKFNDHGVCQACINYENRKYVDWEQRNKELKELCDSYRRTSGYDCVIGVSGGKDSHFIVDKIKNEMKMNPLLVNMTDWFGTSEAGKANLQNLCNTFNCDLFQTSMSPNLFKRLTRFMFEKYGNPLYHTEVCLYALPFKVAISMGIPLVFFGENTAYEYGLTDTDYYNGTKDVISGLESVNFEELLTAGFTMNELNFLRKPPEADYNSIRPEVVYLSYFTPWSSTKHHEHAKKLGFRGLGDEWKRVGSIDNFEQIDSYGYMVHLWLKYPKFGFQRVSDIASRRVREGLISYETAMELINCYDDLIDPKALNDFCTVLGYSEKEFWEIVDRCTNQELFTKRGENMQEIIDYDDLVMEDNNPNSEFYKKWDKAMEEQKNETER